MSADHKSKTKNYGAVSEEKKQTAPAMKGL
jgi:hypothetical protein